MDKNKIIEILQDWNFWKKEQAMGIVRPKYLNRLSSFLDTNQIIAITGPRRAGKSYVMKQQIGNLIKKGVDARNILFVNFEDPRFPELNLDLLDKIYETYLEFLIPTSTPFIFLDEIQEIDGFEKWIGTMHELNKAKIIISGSNSKLLSKELGTLLTGRHLDLTVYPLSFLEYIEFNNSPIADKLDAINKKIELRTLLRNYLEFGAFPEVALSVNKKEILFNYYEDVLNKDIIKRFKIRKHQSLKALVNYYFSNVSTLSTYNSIEKFLKISSDTIEKFSSYLEQTYLVLPLKRFSYKIKEQEKSPRKIYVVDTGLANAIGFRLLENSGRLLENVVFLELKRRAVLNPKIEIYYWKDVHHREVDFLVKEGFDVKELIQVCWKITDEKTKNREIRSLIKAMLEFNLKEAKVVTEDLENEETIEGKTIKFIPIIKWVIAEEQFQSSR